MSKDYIAHPDAKAYWGLTNYDLTSKLPLAPTPTPNPPISTNISAVVHTLKPLTKSSFSQLKTLVTRATHDPSIIYSLVAFRLLTKVDLNPTTVAHLLAIMYNESGFKYNAINGSVRGLYQVQKSNLDSLTDKFLANRRYYVNTFSPLFKVIPHGPESAVALASKGIVDFVNQGTHPVIQAIPGAMLMEENMKFLAKRFRYDSHKGRWTVNGPVDNEWLLNFMKENPAIFSDKEAGYQALLTLIHTEGSPFFNSDKAKPHYPDRINKDIQTYNSLVTTLIPEIRKLVKASDVINE